MEGGTRQPLPELPAEFTATSQGRYERRTWMVDAPGRAVWRDTQCLCGKFHLRAADLILHHAHQEVNLADRLLVANQHGHIHIDVYKMMQKPYRRPEPRVRSRTPARVAPAPWQTQSLNTEVRGVDMEAMYFCLAARQGSWILKIEIGIG